MPRHTSKGSRRNQATFERRTTPPHGLAEESEQAVSKLVRQVKEAPRALREKARERLAQLPDGAQKAIALAQDVAGLCFAPVRLGLGLAREVLRVPLEMIRVLRHQDA